MVYLLVQKVDRWSFQSHLWGHPSSIQVALLPNCFRPGRPQTLVDMRKKFDVRELGLVADSAQDL